MEVDEFLFAFCATFLFHVANLPLLEDAAEKIDQFEAGIVVSFQPESTKALRQLVSAFPALCGRHSHRCVWIGVDEPVEVRRNHGVGLGVEPTDS